MLSEHFGTSQCPVSPLTARAQKRPNASTSPASIFSEKQRKLEDSVCMDDDEVFFVAEIPSSSVSNNDLYQTRLPTPAAIRKATIKEVLGDGNCFFRSAVGFTVYHPYVLFL